MYLFSNEDIASAKEKTLLDLKCDECGKGFSLCKKRIRDNFLRGFNKHFCSHSCSSSNQRTSLEYRCKQCCKKFIRKQSQIKKSENYFCSQSCAATHNNTHKTKGTRRSKLEVWLESQLSEKYPYLKILYSDKETIKSELDIYIPSLRLAFELNGIFHYEPIFGDSKLEQIQNNDNRKFQACLENGIELCIIDTSQQKYFKPSTSQKYLDIISSIIDKKIGEGGNRTLKL